MSHNSSYVSADAVIASLRKASLTKCLSFNH